MDQSRTKLQESINFLKDMLDKANQQGVYKLDESCNVMIHLQTIVKIFNEFTIKVEEKKEEKMDE